MAVLIIDIDIAIYTPIYYICNDVYDKAYPN